MDPEKFEGFGEKSGIGEKIAIIVIDFMKAFTNISSPLGSNFDYQIEQTKKLLDIAREKSIPIIFTTVAYEPSFVDGAHFIKKIPALKELTIGSEASEIDERLERRIQSEPLLIKKFASAFFGTNLFTLLTYFKVDTVIITGCSTSGCVRATAVDALQYGFRVIVPEDCVGDRSEYAHKANLYDIQTKYGDVVHSKDIITFINNEKGAQMDV